MSDPFVKLPHAVIDHADLDAHELLVYIVLLRFRNPKTGKCFPGLQTIADAARMSRRTAIRTIAGLEERGVVKVDRVKAIGSMKNDANTYTVNLLAEDPFKYLGKSAKGTRVPKRSRPVDNSTGGSDSESLPSAVSEQGSDSQSLGSDSQSLGVVTPSHPKKNQLIKNHEEDLTSTFVESGLPIVQFTTQEHQLATESQVAYIKDLSAQISYQAGNGAPNDFHIARWRKLTTLEADNLINQYRKNLGNPFDREYPEPGTPHYEALSPIGKRFADSGGVPSSIREYDTDFKEHIA